MENNSNKDFLEEEQTSEKENNASIEDTDSFDSENTEDTSSTEAYGINTEGNEGSAVNSNVMSKPVKSKRLIQFPLIIAAGIFAATILTFGIWKVFFDTSIEGTWVYENSRDTATSDQTDSNVDSNLYVVFSSKIVNEEKGYKDVSAYQGTQEQHKSYLIEENEDGTKNLQSSLGLAGEYKVTGNWITGRTLTVTATSYDGTEVEQVFRSTFLPKFELPPVSDDFKVNKDIIGEWDLNAEYKVTYTFNEDGTFTLNQNDESVLNGIYVVYEDEGKITLTYIGQGIVSFGVQTFDMTYSKDGDTLVIDGLEYTKAESESK